MAQWPHEEVQESGKLYPETLLRVKVTKQEDMEDNSGRFAVQIDSRIMEPPSLKNQPYSFRFIIGMTADTAQKFGLEEDLLAEEEATWINNPSARRYKSFLKACGVASTGDTEEEAEDVRGKVPLDCGVAIRRRGRAYGHACRERHRSGGNTAGGRQVKRICGGTI